MHLISICSARPNFVKLAAIHHAIAGKGDASVKHTIVHTGQHYDPLFSDIFFEQLGIPLPTENLGIHGGTREETIEQTDKALREVFTRLKPDMVLVYGDVNGAAGAARAARHLGLPLAHVEAGLRSFDDSMPEELNRKEIDHVSHLLFCTEQAGMENLLKEGAPGKAFLVGNTMIDTLVRMLPHIEQEPLPVDIAKPFAVATLHRPSNVDDPETLLGLMQFINEVSQLCPVVLPAHHRLQAALSRMQHQLPATSYQLVPPLGYIPFLKLVQHCAFILTDSGGIQEEATFLGQRCFTLRRNTERPSTIASGSNLLIDPSNPLERKTVLQFAANPQKPIISVPELWDGKTGERILGILLSH